MFTARIFGGLVLATVVIANNSYLLQDELIGESFYSAFKWETFDDPTRGRVNYVDQVTARNTNLSSVSLNGNFIMRADAYQVVQPGARGRDSVRITSNTAYDEAILVLDLAHMPEGCGTWPAWWTLSKAGPWPHGGEIDIIEGVNTATANRASLHTTPGCTASPSRQQTGKCMSGNCDTSVNYNEGCGSSFSKPNSFGSGFNACGGGWFVMQKSRTQGISVWFWPRNDLTVPQSISGGADTLSPPSSWGPPEANFPGDTCPYDTYFDAHQMIFDTTFCGDWAGNDYASSCAALTGVPLCQDFVDNHPDAFLKAYWEIRSLRTYTPKHSITLFS
ncbi:concanavalin A-like lectin/glucanase domain-containing protein [Infundibulicybe gibba]|nr:concanavalin A-like lectin/glucanase domain-containing protein [Infundibulicybe gibba]